MKKPIILFLFALLSGLLFSCNSDSSDKETNTDLLIGKWIPTQTGTIVESGKESLQDIPNPGKCDTGLFEYLSDGTFTSLRYEFQDNKCVSYNKKGTWSLKDKTLNANFDDGPITLEILELNKSTLKLKQSMQFGEIPIVLISVYSRK
ncbi:lipocalin family protein [uncultured Flavobacterium sp.]|uniref:lipocalin family protein n=1 Tax=uncultured Flavobacterium sp. TaxID=165435 RepID=UPI003081490C